MILHSRRHPYLDISIRGNGRVTLGWENGYTDLGEFEYIEDIVEAIHKKIPNAETLKVLSETDAGKGLKKYKSIDDMFSKLHLNPKK